MGSSRDIAEIVDSIFAKYNGNVPGAAFSVMKQGELVYSKVYGLASLEKGESVSYVTNFRLASVTKQFTAMCVMILEEKGRISYEDSLRDLLPEFPEYADDITIRHMLQHTSGLRDYDDFTPDGYKGQLVDRDVLRMLIEVDSTYFPPGSEYRYSNSAYVILGLIIEKISGITFSKFMEREIFKPLEMSNSVLHVPEVTSIRNRAYGYANKNDGFILNDQSGGSLLLGDGGVYSNVTDLLKWDKSLITGKLVSLETLRKAFTRGRLTDGEYTNYGYGWHISEYEGVKLLYHGGSTAGFRNLLINVPDLGVSIVVLTNRNTLDFDLPAVEFKDVAHEFLRAIYPNLQ